MGIDVAALRVQLCEGFQHGDGVPVGNGIGGQTAHRRGPLTQIDAP